jgi:hypothetical protein
MRTLRLLRSFLLLGSVGACVVACSSASPDSSEPSAATNEAWSHGSSAAYACPVATQYLLLTPVSAGTDPSCPWVSGKGGTWKKTEGYTPVDCTPNAPDGTDAILCSYTWSAWNSAPPDVDALLALPGVDVAAGNGSGDSTCDADSMLRFSSLVNLEDVTCNTAHHGGPNPPRECDVCHQIATPGVVYDMLVLPSQPLHTMAVSLTNGTRQVMTYSAPTTSSGRSYLAIPLPTPPRGVSYVGGPAFGYGYTSAGSP